MPTISCEVKKCHYNKDGGCRLEGVKVEGENATVYEETMCASFCDANNSSPVNSASCNCEDYACSFSDIECTAQGCVYNTKGYCDADRIEIGCENSDSCHETECKTFEEK